MSINYVIGDATCPIKKPAIIVHIVNNKNAWGAGFVLSLSKRWKKPEQAYRTMGEYNLGEIDIVYVNETILVVNMIAQNGFRSKMNPIPLKYTALESCLSKVAAYLHEENPKNKKPYSIHMPRIGCGLAGGKWELVEPIIDKALAGIDVFVYDLKRR